MTDIHALIFQENELREYFIVDDCKQEEHPRASVFDWTEVILKLYNSD